MALTIPLGLLVSSTRLSTTAASPNSEEPLSDEYDSQNIHFATVAACCGVGAE
jgi:hypothetical protein